MAVLEIIQRVANAVGITKPTAVIGSTVDEVVQILELFNQEGRQLSTRWGWQALSFEGTFTTVAAESQGTLATIIGATQELRYIVNETIWDRTAAVPIVGPLSKKVWQGYKSLSLRGPYSQYRIKGDQIIFLPAPPAGHSCYFEYVSKMWLTDSGGTNYRRNVVADTDLPLLDDEILCAGLEWRWLRKKGLSYAEEFANYEAMVAMAIGRDGTKPVVSMDNVRERPTRGLYVPIGSWPL
jgi:hypothetical protein